MPSGSTISTTWASPRQRVKKRRGRAMRLLKQKLENEKMARLYREHVLGEKKIEGFVPLDGLARFSSAEAGTEC